MSDGDYSIALLCFDEAAAQIYGWDVFLNFAYTAQN